MPDVIKNLPTDKNEVSTEELNTVNYLFKKDLPLKEKVIGEIKMVILAGILFVLVSLPFLNDIIKQYINITSDYILIAIKSLIFMILFYILKIIII